MKRGLEELRKYSADGGILPDYVSGTVSTRSVEPSDRGRSTGLSYEDYRQLFEDQAAEYSAEGAKWQFLAWCSYFSAGTIDSIAHLLPMRSAAESIPVTDDKRTAKTTRKRRRHWTLIINSIVYGLPSRPLSAYVALGGKWQISLLRQRFSPPKVQGYYISAHENLTRAQCNIIAWTVVQEMKQEDWAIQAEKVSLYDPVHCISACTQVE